MDTSFASRPIGLEMSAGIGLQIGSHVNLVRPNLRAGITLTNETVHHRDYTEIRATEIRASMSGQTVERGAHSPQTKPFGAGGNTSPTLTTEAVFAARATLTQDVFSDIRSE
jgi:hypothetical protein